MAVIKAMARGIPENVDVRFNKDKYQVFFLPFSLLNARARKKSTISPTTVDERAIHKLFFMAAV